MADAATARRRATPMLLVVLALSAGAFALGAINTVMIVSDRTASRKIGDRLTAAEGAREQEAREATRLRKEQEDATSRAMRFQ